MNFTRNDNKTLKPLYITLGLLALGLLYWGIFILKNWWNLSLIPLGMFLFYYAYKNFKKSSFIIEKVEFENTNISIHYLNGTVKTLPQKQLTYALLVKKFYKPIRSIELREKRKSRLGRTKEKKIGVLDINKWDELKNLADYLIHQGYERKKWKFGWGFAEFMMLFAILLQGAEMAADAYVNEGISLPSTSSPTLLANEAADAAAKQKSRSIKESEKAEAKFLSKKTKK